MKANRRLLILTVAALALLVLSFIAAAIVNPYHSLTVDILGSYFPAWMVCIVSGLTLTLVSHWIIQACNLKPYVGPAPLIYLSLMIIFTFATWILFYQN
jgi:hypothetical protein